MSYEKSVIPSKTSEAAREIQAIWEHFLAGRTEGLGRLRPMIRDSWLRCRERKVDLTTKGAHLLLTAEQVGNLQQENELSKTAVPILRLLSDALTEYHAVVILADSQCMTLSLAGHPRTLAAAEQINGRVGAQWLEEQVGTDALTLSALLDTPAQIHWAEHYCEIGKKWTGNAAPIHRPFTKEIIGVLGIYGDEEVAHPQALEMAVDAASLIEQQLYEEELARRLFLFEHYHTHQSRFPNDTLLCLDPKSTILIASPDLLRLLKLLPEEVVGRLLAHLPGVHVPEGALKLQTGDSPYEFPLYTKSGNVLKTTLLPVNKEHSLAGFLAILSAKSTPTKKVHHGSLWQAAYSFADIVGEHPNFLACIARAQRIAQKDLPVLLAGESGTGKELFAHAMHQVSARSEGPFVPLNCGGMNEELLSAELFGYAEGAFTGAVRGGRAGKLELADGGALFLDEVEEMSPKMQAHLLRVLEEGRVVRVGADKPVAINVRVITATNADLEARVREGRFRQDLYYRLSVFTLALPSLRERRTDIPLLVQHILASQGVTKKVDLAALERLKAYCWPGNVRQLRNVLLQAADQATESMITEVNLPAVVCPTTRCPISCPFPYTKAEERAGGRATPLQHAERNTILAALRNCQGNISQAASGLGLHRVTLYRKMKKHGIKADYVCE